MIAMKELLKGAKFEDQSEEIQKNLTTLLERINKVRAKRGLSMTPTSGLRTMEHHIEIYKNLAKQRDVPYDEKKVPMQSRHLYGMAVDIADPDGSLFQWTKDNEKFMEETELWMEEKDDQNRVHFQTVAPKSGKRWFHP